MICWRFFVIMTYLTTGMALSAKRLIIKFCLVSLGLCKKYHIYYYKKKVLISYCPLDRYASWTLSSTLRKHTSYLMNWFLAVSYKRPARRMCWKPSLHRICSKRSVARTMSLSKLAFVWTIFYLYLFTVMDKCSISSA